MRWAVESSSGTVLFRRRSSTTRKYRPRGSVVVEDFRENHRKRECPPVFKPPYRVFSQTAFVYPFRYRVYINRHIASPPAPLPLLPPVSCDVMAVKRAGVFVSLSGSQSRYLIPRNGFRFSAVVEGKREECVRVGGGCPGMLLPIETRKQTPKQTLKERRRQTGWP
ncbi:hypothetical protein LY76DRAFT_365351 [Colletotrichum caudatum]|nr:hypothetical protein LY76DRAFT_365351 [Colletotrichum caudatum]